MNAMRLSFSLSKFIAGLGNGLATYLLASVFGADHSAAAAAAAAVFAIVPWVAPDDRKGG